MIRNVVIILRCLNELKSTARELRNLFEDDEDSILLLKVRDQLKAKYDELISLLPKNFVDPSNFLRHTNFLKYYLEKNKKDSCIHDIKDIIDYDIPQMEESLISILDRPEHFDKELSQKITKLIEADELDSVIRKAFVVLTERLRKRYCPTETGKDGSELINLIFGSKSGVDTSFDEKDNLALRNLLDGLYSFYRNKWAHNDGNPSSSELEGIVSIINDILKKIS